MKHHNLQHEVILYSDDSLVKDTVKGDKAMYSQKVGNISFYQSMNGENYNKIYLHRDMILDLANQIIEIEKNIEEKPFFDHPF